jgi:hypothetical protein
MKNNILLVLLILFSSACEKVIFDLSYSNKPVDNFESMWTEFDQLYGLFKVRNLDWDSVYQVYHPQVNNNMDDSELYEVLVSMLTLLNDSHVGLLPTNSNLPQFQGGIGGRIDTIRDFNLDLVRENYLPFPIETDPFTYGFVNDSIGYLYVAWEPEEKSIHKEMPTIVDHFRDAKGIIIDIRSNTGGEDRGGQAFASYFTDQTRLYMTTSIKNGPGPDDFTPLQEWYITPQDKHLLQPLVLLTNRATVSAAETLTLAMRSLPQLTMLGDTTTGAFSNAVNRELPNGWLYSMSIGDWRAADGTSYEGKGIPPTVVIQNKATELRSGQDKVLEAAIASF